MVPPRRRSWPPSSTARAPHFRASSSSSRAAAIAYRWSSGDSFPVRLSIYNTYEWCNNYFSHFREICVRGRWHSQWSHAHASVGGFYQSVFGKVKLVAPHSSGQQMGTENGNMAIGSWKNREIFVTNLKYETTHIYTTKPYLIRHRNRGALLVFSELFIITPLAWFRFW